VFAQAILREALARRLEAVGSAQTPEVCAIVVVRDVDVASFVTGALAHTVALPPPVQDAWYRAFTRTVFLAGQPDQLARRFPAGERSPNGAMSWFAADEPAAYEGLRRLLRAFEGPRLPPDLPAAVKLRFPGRAGVPGRTRRLFVGIAGLGTQQYLVHLHHTVCEAALRGLIGPGDALEVVHMPEIDESVGPWDYARVHADHADEQRLRLHACLSPPLATHFEEDQ
jgi:hypothetical protein